MAEGNQFLEHDDPPTLIGEAVLLRALLREDGNETYAGWMNDQGIVEYTESRFASYTPDELKRYIQDVRSDPLSHMWAICDVGSGDHVGTSSWVRLIPITNSGISG